MRSNLKRSFYQGPCIQVLRVKYNCINISFIKCVMMRFLCKSIVLMLTLNILRYLYAVPFSLRDNLFGKEHFYHRRAGNIFFDLYLLENDNLDISHRSWSHSHIFKCLFSKISRVLSPFCSQPRFHADDY